MAGIHIKPFLFFCYSSLYTLYHMCTLRDTSLSHRHKYKRELLVKDAFWCRCSSVEQRVLHLRVFSYRLFNCSKLIIELFVSRGNASNSTAIAAISLIFCDVCFAISAKDVSFFNNISEELMSGYR